MTRIAEGLGARMDEIATIVTHEAGMPKWLSLIVQVGLPINSFNAGGRPRRQLPVRRGATATASIVREPVGVVGCITPWNYPLHQIAAKVAYAMAAGCTVVLKPSEVAPLDAFVLAEVINEVGLPGRRVQPGHRHRARRGRGDRRPVPTSTWCRSPARPAPASASPSSASQIAEEGRARARREVGQHPARRPRRRERSRRPSATASARPTSTRARPARRSPACSCRGTGWPTPSSIAADEVEPR